MGPFSCGHLIGVVWDVLHRFYLYFCPWYWLWMKCFFNFLCQSILALKCSFATSTVGQYWIWGVFATSFVSQYRFWNLSMTSTVGQYWIWGVFATSFVSQYRFWNVSMTSAVGQYWLWNVLLRLLLLVNIGFEVFLHPLKCSFATSTVGQYWLFNFGRADICLPRPQSSEQSFN